MRWTQFAASIVLVVVSTGVSRGDLLVSGYEAARNDRFYSGPDKDFVGGSLDFSGVGNTSTSGTGSWATLISASYFLSSAHDHPGVSSTVTFHENNDPNGPTHTYTVASGVQVGTSDLFLEKLTAPIPTSDNLHPYAIVMNDESALTGMKIDVYGTPNRLGFNNIDGFATVSNVQGSSAVGRAFIYDYDPVSGFDPGEAKVQGGDSGGPSFVEIQGQLGLVGIHWFQYSDTNPSRTGSGDTYVSDYISQIDDLMTDSGEQVTVIAVPEPSSILLFTLGLAGAGLVLRRPTSRARSGERSR